MHRVPARALMRLHACSCLVGFMQVYLFRCLLEALEAKRRSVPLLFLEMRGSGFDVDKAVSFVENLEEELPKHSATALDIILDHLGIHHFFECYLNAYELK